MNTNELLPIIRRVRRPLVPVDAPPVPVGNVEPVPVVAASEQPTKPATIIKPSKNRAKPAAR
jgi:hypothetical protein